MSSSSDSVLLELVSGQLCAQTGISEINSTGWRLGSLGCLSSGNGRGVTQSNALPKRIRSDLGRGGSAVSPPLSPGSIHAI